MVDRKYVGGGMAMGCQGAVASLSDYSLSLVVEIFVESWLEVVCNTQPWFTELKNSENIKAAKDGTQHFLVKHSVDTLSFIRVKKPDITGYEISGAAGLS